MIKNQIQAGITERRLQELKQAKVELETSQNNMNNAQYRLGISSFNSMINDLENQLSEYRGLNESNFHVLKVKSFNEVPKVLISARLAQNMSQKALGELIGVKEQQIQRYEITDYETASWVRIVEIAEALHLQICFEKIIILKETDDDLFTYPSGITKDAVNKASEYFRKRGCLIN